jgi:hypothetical protein
MPINPKSLENLKARAGKGRPKGVPNKTTADVKALAQKHTDAAMSELARLAMNAEQEGTRVAAIKELLDRGYGKATQPVGQDPDLDPVVLGVFHIPAKSE